MQASAPEPLRDAFYPRFSAGEMRRRRRALAEVCHAEGVDVVLVYGAARAGSGVQWLTGWPTTHEAVVLWRPGERPRLLVQFYNHVPLARELANDAEVGWGGARTADTVAEELSGRGRGRPRVGVIGALPFTFHAVLAPTAEVVDLTPRYVDLRLVKSAEELAWMRAGAELSDAAVAALAEGLRPGLTEFELADLVERAYVPRGGTTHIHYFAVTSMADPVRSVPAQFPSARPVRRGDVVTTELSAAFWGYPGQVLRTFTVEEEPTPLYRDLHGVAVAAFDAIVAVLRDGATTEEVVAAASAIGEAGYTTCDDLVHGFGGGYLPPVISVAAGRGDVPPSRRFSAGMTVVVQPNVVTPDGRAGVQTGELVLVTHEGVEFLHRAPRGLRTVGLGVAG